MNYLKCYMILYKLTNDFLEQKKNLLVATNVIILFYL